MAMMDQPPLFFSCRSQVHLLPLTHSTDGSSCRMRALICLHSQPSQLLSLTLPHMPSLLSAGSHDGLIPIDEVLSAETHLEVHLPRAQPEEIGAQLCYPAVSCGCFMSVWVGNMR
jgi:hypothetical protein